MTQIRTTKQFKNLYRPFYFTFFLVALILTLILFYWQKGMLKPKRVLLTKKITFNEKHIVQEFFNDFDHDGFSEKVRFKYRVPQKQLSIMYYTKDEKPFDYWNLSEKWVPQAVYFADYDNDQFDEVYFFTLANDSLFLYSFDPRLRNQFLLFRQFIACAPKPNPYRRQVWDLATPQAVFFDADQDGYKECFIALAAGFSLQPRGLFRLDLDQQKITARTPFFGAYITHPIPVDLDGNGIPEILMGKSTATDNYNKRIIFRDRNAYLMIFDKDLNFFLKPKVYHNFQSNIINIPYTLNNRSFIFTSYFYQGHLNINSRIFLYNFKGRQLRQKVFPKGEVLIPFVITKNNHEQLFLVDQNQGTILKPNFNLDIVQTISLEFPVQSIAGQNDLDGDLQNELIIISQQQNYCIVSHNFNHSYLLPVKARESDLVQFLQKGNQGSALIIQQANTIYRFNYAVNPLFTWRYPLFIFITALFYFLLSGLFLLWQKILAVLLVHKNLFQFTQNGLCIINHRAKIDYLNGNFEHHLHLSRHIEKCAYFFESLEERPEVVEFVRKLIVFKTFQEKEIIIRTDQGAVPLLLRGSVIRGVLKIPAGFLIETIPQNSKVFHQKLEIWTKTVQKMAHDIKTPLATVQLLIQAIRLRLKDSQVPKEDLLENDFSTIEQELSRIREMTRHFLRFTNLEKPNLQWTSLRKLLNRVLEKFTYYINEGLQIKLELDEKHDRLLIDPVLLEMVFQIVIENALDAMENRGVIIISSSLIENIEENFRRYLEIEIVDNGPGIPPEILDQVFEPFFTTKENGTGMGLTLAKKIINDHDGKIEIDSRAEKSTCVKIWLPYREEKTNGVQTTFS